MNELNKRIYTCRRLAELTQSEVAEKLGIKCSTYSQMERAGQISADRVFKLAEIFNVEPCYLYYGEKFCKQEQPVTAPTISEEMPRLSAEIEKPIATKFVCTQKEERLISILRNLPKQKRDEAINFISKLHQSEKYKD